MGLILVVNRPPEDKVPENRSATRHEVSLVATVEVDGETYESLTYNLSLGGGHFGFDRRLPMGQRVQVTFRIPTQEDPITVGGAVRWAASTGIGVQFDGLRAKEVWSLNKYFDSLPVDL